MLKNRILIVKLFSILVLDDTGIEYQLGTIVDAISERTVIRHLHCAILSRTKNSVVFLMNVCCVRGLSVLMKTT